MTLKQAAMELDSIRNNRTDPENVLQARVDAVGRWLASQKTSDKLMKLLQEAHQLSDRLGGGNGKGGVRLQIVGGE